jgi:hypothetical protein
LPAAVAAADGAAGAPLIGAMKSAGAVCACAASPETAITATAPMAACRILIPIFTLSPVLAVLSDFVTELHFVASS